MYFAQNQNQHVLTDSKFSKRKKKPFSQHTSLSPQVRTCLHNCLWKHRCLRLFNKRKEFPFFEQTLGDLFLFYPLFILTMLVPFASWKGEVYHMYWPATLLTVFIHAPFHWPGSLRWEAALVMGVENIQKPPITICMSLSRSCAWWTLLSKTASLKYSGDKKIWSTHSIHKQQNSQ